MRSAEVALIGQARRVKLQPYVVVRRRRDGPAVGGLQSSPAATHGPHIREFERGEGIKLQNAGKSTARWTLARSTRTCDNQASSKP